MAKKVLLFASTTGYQVREFSNAASSLGIELVLATDRCHILDNPWGDDAAPIRFEDPSPGIESLSARGPFDGILAVGDKPTCIAAQAAEHLGLNYHPAEAARAASNKLLTRERFRAGGLLVPSFREFSPDHPPLDVQFPCVIKPLDASASRGVIRANNRDEFLQAVQRASLISAGSLLVEDYIPGREFALEGMVTNGTLTTLALFDKPDPLEGPFFEETIYTTPSREFESIQQSIEEVTQKAITALRLTNGPIHAEMRVNDSGVWMLEVAPRPIGGLCARALRFSPDDVSLESILLRHALGEDMSFTKLTPGAHGVMMIPIPRAGVYRGVHGLEAARSVPGIEDAIIAAKEGQTLVPLPEGSTYLGFLFSRGDSADSVEKALRSAFERLEFVFSTELPVLTKAFSQRRMSLKGGDTELLSKSDG